MSPELSMKQSRRKRFFCSIETVSRGRSIFAKLANIFENFLVAKDFFFEQSFKLTSEERLLQYQLCLKEKSDLSVALL
jgi:hypothetical protein